MTKQGTCSNCRVEFRFPDMTEPLKRLGCPRCGTPLKRVGKNWTGQITHGTPVVLPA